MTEVNGEDDDGKCRVQVQNLYLSLLALYFIAGVSVP
jgi:hypothetical protein